MESSGGLPPDNDKHPIVYQQQNMNTSTTQDLSLIGVSTASQQSLEKLSRPAAFDKMEALVREMQDPENGVPVRQQKLFLTSIPYAFMGYDLIEWLMDRLSIEESEALSVANQLCLHGYYFPVNDTKSLVVKDDSSLYRFQTPYYWPWQHKAPDNVEYAIYLCKRSLRNKQRHGLEDYESEALASLHKNLKGKWDFISMQAEEQVRLAKERKKGDKIVGDSQERAYWRVHRPPPGQFTPLEPCPIPTRDRQGFKQKKRTVDDWQREIDYLKKSLGRTRMKMSQVCESLVNYWETFAEYDFFLQPVLPSNPWVSEDTTFWQLSNPIVDTPTEKRVKRWAISIEELVSDPTGIQEFTTFLEKEYSHENIRFWIEVNRLRRSAHSQVADKVNRIYEEFLKPGAPCEINIDSKTMEAVQKGLQNPSRFTFDAAAEHIYTLLLKKDCYPRFIRSDHYKSLLASGIQPSHKKRFFGFGGAAKKKSSTSVSTGQGMLSQTSTSGIVPPPGILSRRRGSDRSLTGSAHELAVIGVKDFTSKVPHSHSQSNLSEIPYREAAKPIEKLETTAEVASCAVCPWETTVEQTESSPVFQSNPMNTKPSVISEMSEVSERMRQSCGLRQHTVDNDYSDKRLIPHMIEPRRASMTTTHRLSEIQLAPSKLPITKISTTPSPTSFRHSDDQTLSPSAIKTPASEYSDDCNIAVILPETESELSDNKNKFININIDVKQSDESNNVKDIQSENSDVTIEKCENVLVPNLSTENSSDNNVLLQSQKLTSSIHKMCIVGVVTEKEIKLTTYDQAQSPINNNNETKNVIRPPVVNTDDMIEVVHQVSNEGNQDISNEAITQEELSPTTDEYQECAQFVDSTDVYHEYAIDVESNLTSGCVAPTPTPAPSLAPLAEIDVDPMEEEQEYADVKQDGEEIKKRRKKKDKDGKKTDEKGNVVEQPKEKDDSGNTVCPWEDEDMNTSDATFVKTYATLGYL